MKTVLYAEDSPDDVFFMRRALKQFADGTSLEVAQNGAEAIAFLSGENSIPSLVLLDLSMPIKNGFEVLEWIRAKSETKHLPVFVLTSSNYEGDRERATALGANGYLVKPNQPDKLAELLQSCQKYLL